MQETGEGQYFVPQVTEGPELDLDAGFRELHDILEDGGGLMLEDDIMLLIIRMLKSFLGRLGCLTDEERSEGT